MYNQSRLNDEFALGTSGGFGRIGRRYATVGRADQYNSAELYYQARAHRSRQLAQMVKVALRTVGRVFARVLRGLHV